MGSDKKSPQTPPRGPSKDGQHTPSDSPPDWHALDLDVKDILSFHYSLHSKSGWYEIRDFGYHIRWISGKSLLYDQIQAWWTPERKARAEAREKVGEWITEFPFDQ